MALKTRLKYVLLDKNLKVRELAELIGADPTQVSNWINDRRAPTLERAIQIAKALGVSVEDLWELV